MIITVEFLGSLRHASGKELFSVDCRESVSVLGLIKTLASRKPVLRRSLLDERLEEPVPNALILVNGKEISVLNGLGTLLKDGDEVTFVPVVHGG